MTLHLRSADIKPIREALPWLIALAHHPLYSNGIHGDHAHLIADWEPPFKEHGVNFYFCGHDHDMQHMEFEGHPTSFVLSGGGGARIREIKEIKHGPFGQGIYGFSDPYRATLSSGRRNALDDSGVGP